MERIDPIRPQPRGVDAILPVHRKHDPEDPEERRREETERRRRPAAPSPAPPDDDGRPHIDVRV